MVQQGKSEGFDTCDRPSNLKLDSNRRFVSPCYLEIWWMTLKNNRALLLYYIKHCASFQIHRWSQTWVTVRKHSVRVKIGEFLCVSSLNLKIDGWPWNTIGHPFYTTLSFVHHFKAMGEYQTGATVRKRSIRVKIGNFLSRVTLKFDGWPRKTIGHSSMLLSTLCNIS